MVPDLTFDQKVEKIRGNSFQILNNMEHITVILETKNIHEMFTGFILWNEEMGSPGMAVVSVNWRQTSEFQIAEELEYSAGKVRKKDMPWGMKEDINLNMTWIHIHKKRPQSLAEIIWCGVESWSAGGYVVSSPSNAERPHLVTMLFSLEPRKVML